MRKMIAYCGLDCEKCDAYIATVRDDQALREKTAKAWSELNHLFLHTPAYDLFPCTADIHGIASTHVETVCKRPTRSAFWTRSAVPTTVSGQNIM